MKVIKLLNDESEVFVYEIWNCNDGLIICRSVTQFRNQVKLGEN